jgi:cysteinyl-tRNA synthetase
MASTTRKQPPWTAPKPAPGVQLPQLQIHNSLTRQKEAFVPQDPAGKKVTWYACGPTVYDDAHLGHARNYMSTDILRRILKFYFNFEVKFVMNITDVDDKIILRGRQQYLLAKLKKEFMDVDENLVAETLKAFDAYIKKNLPLLQNVTPADFDASSKKAYKPVLEGKALEGDGPPTDKEAKIKMHLRTATSAASALTNPPLLSLEDFYTKAEDVLLPYLDSLYGSGIDASDHSVFTTLTQKYENRFFEDMDSLNNLRPDVIVRVTEFGPQIVKFVEKIANNGFAYATSDGSVYFDIGAFEKAGNSYARLEPWSRGDKDLLADGEGALAQKKTSEKRSDADFALWKSSKPGEPAWPSPWGPGRPGWHIECSVMASEALGSVMDIHSGGIDLAFPHHDNELAQSEAYWLSSDKHDCASHGGHEWVKYFIHMGHLSIAGSKMSKSLKNFTTVREALSRGEWTPRGLRIVFLLGGWRDGVEIAEQLVKTGASFEDKITNYFLKAKEVERNAASPDASTTTSATEKGNDSILLEKFSQAEKDLEAALCDSFDTPKALQTISDLVTDFNSVPTSTLNDETVLVISRWVTRILTIFGLDGKEDPNDTTRIGWAGVEIPLPAQEFVYPLSGLRDELRKQARSKEISYSTITKLASENTPEKIQDEDKIQYAEVFSQFQDDMKALAEKEAPAKDLLALADKLRDLKLWDLGIYLEDRDGLPALVRPVDKTLLAQREEKENQAQAKIAAKAKREAEEVEKKKAAEEKAKIRPEDIFKTEEFGEWDKDGLPTKMKDGKEVSKAKLKKLIKEWEKQKKLHEEWVKGQGSSS